MEFSKAEMSTNLSQSGTMIELVTTLLIIEHKDCCFTKMMSLQYNAFWLKIDFSFNLDTDAIRAVMQTFPFPD